MNTQPNHANRYPVPSMAKYKGINANLEKVPNVRSSKRWYRDKEKRKVLYILCGSLLCVLMIIAACAIPIALVIIYDTTTTTVSTSSTLSSTVMTTASNVTNTTSMSNLTTTTTTTTTTTPCPNMTCTYSAIASPMSPTWGVEHLDINCTQSLSDMSIDIIVQRTVNATYAKQYETFWNLTTNMSYVETSSVITYSWRLLPGQIIQAIGFPYFVEGQYQLFNVNQTTSFDTYSATLTSICGHTVAAEGTF